MTDEHSEGPGPDSQLPRRLPRHVAILGVISLLTAMSSAMVYGLLPVFLIKMLGASTASVGFIEGIAEAMMSLARIISGLASDRMGRRKPLVLLGYAVSAINKVMFPLAGAVSMVLAARVIDRIGKGLRDAPRDAFMTDVTPAKIRGSGFGLRLAFYTTGFVIGPLTAMGLMKLSGDDFRLVFWVAVVPAVLAIIILLYGITEIAPKKFIPRPLLLRRSEFALFTGAFWWAIAVASLLSLARFSYRALMGMLRSDEIGASGLAEGSGLFERIPCSIWGHEDFHINVHGDVFQINDQCENPPLDRLIKRWAAVEVRAPAGIQMPAMFNVQPTTYQDERSVTTAYRAVAPLDRSQKTRRSPKADAVAAALEQVGIKKRPLGLTNKEIATKIAPLLSGKHTRQQKTSDCSSSYADAFAAAWQILPIDFDRSSSIARLATRKRKFVNA